MYPLMKEFVLTSCSPVRVIEGELKDVPSEDLPPLTPLALGVKTEQEKKMVTQLGKMIRIIGDRVRDDREFQEWVFQPLQNFRPHIRILKTSVINTNMSQSVLLSLSQCNWWSGLFPRLQVGQIYGCGRQSFWTWDHLGEDRCALLCCRQTCSQGGVTFFQIRIDWGAI